MTANTLRFSELNAKMSTPLNSINSLDEEDTMTNNEPIVCIELCFTEDIESHPIDTSE